MNQARQAPESCGQAQLYRRMAMYQRDWMDELHIGAIGLGAGVAVAAQLALALLVLRPLELGSGLVAVVLVALCVLGGAFSAARKARRAPRANGLICGLLCAVISLVATAVHTPAGLSPANTAFLFGSFGVLGMLGGLIAARIQSGRASR
jgi:putative membrane protein (TIGR04086 family)